MTGYAVRTPYQAVLFDLDGTLLHTVPDLAAAVNAMLRDLGEPELTETQVAQYVGKGSASLVHRCLTLSLDEQAAPERFTKAHALWGQHYEHLNGQQAQFYPHVQESLSELWQAHVPMAVVTNKPYHFAQALLQRMNIHPYFKVLVGGDTCAHRKPHPQPVLHACQLLGVSPSEVLFVGDSANDWQAATAAGVDCCLLPYGYHEAGESLFDIEGYRGVKHLQEVVQMVLGRTKG